MHCGADFEADPADVPSTTAGGETTTESTGTEESHLLHPDSLADNTLTVLVGLVGGAAVGVLTLVLFLFTTQSVWSLLPAVVAWLGATGYLVTRRTVGAAFQFGCYGVAFLLVALPIIAFSGATKGGTFGGRVLLFLGGELLFGIVALVVAAIGHVAGN